METTPKVNEVAGHAAPTPYAGLRVVELGGDLSGEMAGMQLVNMGAEVIKVEPPGGTLSRHIGPYVDDAPDPERSLSYWYYNSGKRSVLLDVTRTEHRRALERLLDDADVLLSSLHPTELRELNIDLTVVSEARPSLIVLSVTPFGLTGPWADRLSSDLVGLATSGLLNTSGYDDHSIPPIRPGGDQAFHTAASFAHVACGLALVERQRTGQGGLVDVSMHEATGLSVELANMYWHYPKALVYRQTCRHAQPVPTQPALFACADGRYVFLSLILADPKPWHALVQWLDSEGMATDLTDPAYDELPHRQENFPHVQDVLECFFLIQDADTVFHEGQARGLPIGVLSAPEELYDDVHLQARGFFEAVDQPGYGEVLHPASPFRMSAWGRAARGPAPRLGEADKELLAPGAEGKAG
jgi:crotonobetainyl-CoA:carnitine CoA-transferase CaiB-like acyl-CoA transferase